jgi:DNA-binding Lrp family transcriptional regulator
MQEPLDRIDIAILRALQKDGRISNKELAAHVGLAASSCLERVRRLRQRGVLRGFRALIDPLALGVGLQAMIAVRLRTHKADANRAFAQRVLALREVLSVFYVAGPEDFQVHVAVRDAAHLRDLVALIPDLGEVAHIQTALIFDHYEADVLPDYTDKAR